MPELPQKMTPCRRRASLAFSAAATALFAGLCSGQTAARAQGVLVTDDTTIFRYDSAGNYLGIFAAGLPGSYQIAQDHAGNVYVTTDTDNHVLKFNADGTNESVFATLPANSDAGGIAIDSAGNVYVGAWQSGALYKYSASGTLLTSVSLTDLAHPDGLALGPDGALYLVSNFTGKIERFATGDLSDLGTLLTVQGAEALVFDSSGDLYVTSDYGASNRYVTEYSPSGVLIGDSGAISGNGRLIGIALGAGGGGVLVGDYGNGRVDSLSATNLAAPVSQWNAASPALSQPFGILVTSSPEPASLPLCAVVLAPLAFPAARSAAMRRRRAI